MSHDCLCGQHGVPSPPAQDWVVETIHDRGQGEYYRYRITGRNLNYPPCHPSHKFSWSVRDLDDPRYDVSAASEAPSTALARVVDAMERAETATRDMVDAFTTLINEG